MGRTSSTVRLGPRQALSLMLAGSRPLVLVVFLVLALASGFLEAGVILVVLAVAAGLAAGDGEVEASLGPLDISLSTAEGIAVGVALTLALVACAVPNAWLAARIAARTLARLRAQLLRALLNAGWEQQSSVSEARFQDLAAVHAVRVANLVLTITILLTSILGLLALVVAAMLVDVVVAAVLLAVVAALAASFRPLISSIRHRASRFITAHHAYVGRLAELLQVLPEVRVLGVRDAAAAELDATDARAVHEFRYSRFRGRLLPSLYTGATVLLVLLGLAIASTQEALSLAGFGAIVVFLLRSLRHSQQVQTSWQSVSELLPYYERLEEAMQEWSPSAGEFGDRTLRRAGVLELRDATYVYPTGQVGIEHATVTINPGDVVGLEGPSGSGKSTLAQILLGLRRPTSGEYLVDGEPVQRFDEASWFSRFAYVAQDPKLIEGSVRDNVRFLRPEVDDDDVDRALAEAGIERDVDDWSAGRDHQVGSRGRELSGGQRQRVAIARALAGDPDVLVMDEPTSSLDRDSEQIVRSTIEALRGRITVVLIAHRPSTLTVCDRILTVRDHGVHERDALAVEAATEPR